MIGGISDIVNVMCGTTQIKKIYASTQLVWENFKGFTFEGKKTRRYRIEYVSLPEADPTKFKNMWAIIDGVDRPIWRSDSLDTLEVDTSPTCQFITILTPDNKVGTYTTLDTGEELPNGAYTFKVELF